MTTTVAPRRSRPPLTILYRGRLYTRSGRGSLPCSAAYRAPNGEELTLLYCTFERSTPDWAIMTSHGRGPSVCVSRANMPSVFYTSRSVFVAGPVVPHDANYLRAERAWLCD